MLDDFNVHAKSFKMARDVYKDHSYDNLKLRLIAYRNKDGRVYNIPNVSKVAALIVGDVDNASPKDIIMEKRSGKLQRINELHTSYLGHKYPLLFPYNEDGNRHDVNHRERMLPRNIKRNHLTIREWFCFRIQIRHCEASTLLRSRRLFQQFIVDDYTMIEYERLSFIRKNQSKLKELINIIIFMNNQLVVQITMDHKKVKGFDEDIGAVDRRKCAMFARERPSNVDCSVGSIGKRSGRSNMEVNAGISQASH